MTGKNNIIMNIDYRILENQNELLWRSLRDLVLNKNVKHDKSNIFCSTTPRNVTIFPPVFVALFLFFGCVLSREN